MRPSSFFRTIVMLMRPAGARASSTRNRRAIQSETDGADKLEFHERPTTTRLVPESPGPGRCCMHIGTAARCETTPRLRHTGTGSASKRSKAHCVHSKDARIICSDFVDSDDDEYSNEDQNKQYNPPHNTGARNPVLHKHAQKKSDNRQGAGRFHGASQRHNLDKQRRDALARMVTSWDLPMLLHREPPGM